MDRERLTNRCRTPGTSGFRRVHDVLLGQKRGAGTRFRSLRDGNPNNQIPYQDDDGGDSPHSAKNTYGAARLASVTVDAEKRVGFIPMP